MVEEVNRYRPGKLILNGDALKHTRVQASFSLDRLDDVNWPEYLRKRSLLYLAPEVMHLCLKQEQDDAQRCAKLDWRKADVFALGVTLYSLVFFASPFEKNRASRNDAAFQFVYLRQFDKFWDSSAQQRTIISSLIERVGQLDTFVLLGFLQQMIQYDPAHRPTAEQLLKHEFLQK